MEVEKAAVETAVTHLAQARKGKDTLQKHIEGLYRTTCATCGRHTIADAFIWERDSAAPVAKRYHCDACGDTSDAPTDKADQDLAAGFEERGLSYWLMLDRAAPRGAPYRERITPLLDLYTPRNLSALNDLLLKSDSLHLAAPPRRVLDALLLDTIDQANSLRSVDAPKTRPRRLQHPARYIEANVWRLLEQTLDDWRAATPIPIPYTSHLGTLLDPDEAADAAVYLGTLSSTQARRDLPPGCSALIVVDPPRPDTTLWHLSALWCSWLWGTQAAGHLMPTLGRRWLDKDWLWRGLRAALHNIAPLLQPHGRLICIFVDDNPAMLEAIALAAAGSGYELVGWGVRSNIKVRLNWSHREAPTQMDDEINGTTPRDIDTISRSVSQQVADTVLNVLRLRGEPAPWPTLHAAVYAKLAESGLLAQIAAQGDSITDHLLSWLADIVRSALDGAPLRQFTDASLKNEPFWWLDEPMESQAASPLSDRIELAVAEILRDLLAVSETDLNRRVCRRCPGSLTPDANLVRLCLDSYGDEHVPGHWRLRVEDDLEARVSETDTVIADLSALGRRLGFDVALGIPSAGEWAVRWLDEMGHATFVFAVRTTAVLGDLLFTSLLPLSLPPDSKTSHEEDIGAKTTPCLTLPGGRAILVDYKLRHDPRLRQQVKQHGWKFLKFRHLRHLVKEVAAKQLDRYAFQAALGLDPIVEQEEAQLSLW
jgi:hypothetical protein